MASAFSLQLGKCQQQFELQTKRLYLAIHIHVHLLYIYINVYMYVYVYIVCLYVLLAFESADPKCFYYCQQSSLSYRNAFEWVATICQASVVSELLWGTVQPLTGLTDCQLVQRVDHLTALSSVEWVSSAGMPHSKKIHRDSTKKRLCQISCGCVRTCCTYLPEKPYI